MQTWQPPSFSSPPAPPRPHWTPLKTAALVVGGVTLAVIAGVAWWLISPNFLHTTAHDPNPFASATPAGSSSAPGATQTPAPNTSGPVILATGTFIDTGSGDHGSGTVTIGRTAEGAYILHLDNLNISSGPDLHVYLATVANPSSSNEVTNGGVDLGTLKAREGSVNVDLPTEVASHLTQYQSVVIYCKSFSVIFTVAPLQFSA
jgi:hypothetical protein